MGVTKSESPAIRGVERGLGGDIGSVSPQNSDEKEIQKWKEKR